MICPCIFTNSTFCNLQCKLQKVKFVKNAWAYHKNLDIKVDQIGYMYSKQVVMVNFSTSKSNFQNFGQKVTPPYFLQVTTNLT